jgi:hypothetical protein
MRQASTRANPFSDDVEHSPGYMEAIRNGTPLTELRRRSAGHAITEAVHREPSPVLHESPAWCGRFFPWGQCRPATPCEGCRGHRTVVHDSSAGGTVTAPRQASKLYRDWEQFPDHAAGSTPAHAPIPPPGTGPEPDWAERTGDFAQARAQAAQIPGREPGQVVQGPGE